MKINKLNTVPLLLLIAFLNVFSSLALSYPSEDLNLDSKNFDYLQADQNKNAIFFEEASLSISFKQESSNKFLSSGSIPDFLFSGFILSKNFEVKSNWFYSPNSRQLLTQQIFPFQFFW